MPNSGWNLILDEGDKDVLCCLICEKEVEGGGFFCPRMNRLIHRECEEGYNHKKCRGMEIEHQHFNIIHITKPKGGFKE